MKTTLLQYKATEAGRGENRTLIGDVFAELKQSGRTDIGYMVFELADGGFVHIATLPEDSSTLTGMPAFRRFAENAAARQAVRSVQSTAQIVGNYRMLDETLR